MLSKKILAEKRFQFRRPNSDLRPHARPPTAASHRNAIAINVRRDGPAIHLWFVADLGSLVHTPASLTSETLFLVRRFQSLFESFVSSKSQITVFFFFQISSCFRKFHFRYWIFGFTLPEVFRNPKIVYRKWYFRFANKFHYGDIIAKLSLYCESAIYVKLAIGMRSATFTVHLDLLKLFFSLQIIIRTLGWVAWI